MRCHMNGKESGIKHPTTTQHGEKDGKNANQ